MFKIINVFVQLIITRKYSRQYLFPNIFVSVFNNIQVAFYIISYNTNVDTKTNAIDCSVSFIYVGMTTVKLGLIESHLTFYQTVKIIIMLK